MEYKRYMWNEATRTRLHTINERGKNRMTTNTLKLSTIRSAIRDLKPNTPDELHGYCRLMFGFDITRRHMLDGMSAPFDYLCHAFFQTNPVRDCVVWANRGGGKTQLGAIATLLDLMFKPGIQIRILGGSMDQSSKMYAYLRQLLERDELIDLVHGRITNRRITLTNGSVVEILAQSEQSVRGNRVQILRCDEVELFSPEVWQAAQFVTQSSQCGETFVPGCIEVLSTMHRPFGLMQQLAADTDNRTIFRWSIMDVIEHCPEHRTCESCSLHPDCLGRAKQSRGFFQINDAIQQRARTSSNAWQSEMLCLHPSRSDCVYPEFDTQKHIQLFNQKKNNEESPETWIGGMDFGFRSPTVMLWACLRSDGVVHLVDEHIASEKTIEQHLEIIKARPWPKPQWLGIDPAGYQRHEHLGVSTATLLKQAGFTIRTRRSELHTGLETVRARLQSADGNIRLAIDPRCEKLIRALQTYHFPPERPEAVEPVKDGADHACDALRYMLVNLDHAQKPLQIKRY